MAPVNSSLPVPAHTPASGQSMEKMLEEMKAENRRLKMEVTLLQEALRLERIKKYGAKGDQLSDDQLSLLELEPGVRQAEVDQEAALPEAEKTPSRRKAPRKNHPGRNPLPAHLPRVECTCEVKGDARLCECCGKEKAVIGYEITEILDVKPAEYFVRVIRREKLACKDHPESGVATAPAESCGPKIVEKGKLSDAVLCDVVIKKFADAMPVYRQQASLLRDHGIDIARQTLCDGVMAVGDLLIPVSRAMASDLLAGGYIQADETPVGVQSAETQGRNHQAYQWQYSRPHGPVVFDFQMGRSREGPAKFLKNFDGLLQTDGYSAYEKTGDRSMRHAGCWAHARRGFVDALKLNADDALARSVLAHINELYDIEREARECGLNDAARLALRQSRSQRVMDMLRVKILDVRSKSMPGSKVAKACDYTLGQWKKLQVYLSDGRCEIDNNWAENAMRPIALGRKNWLHIGSEQAGPRIAAIFSIMETCKRNAINLRDYLGAVLPRLGSWDNRRVGELTPIAWAATRCHAGSSREE